MPEVTANLKGEVRVPGNHTPGTELIPRLTRLGEWAIQTYGKYYEAAKLGILFHATQTTLVGLAPGTDAAGTAAVLVLHNPSNSGLDAVILEGRVGRGSTGDIGPGTVYWMMENDSTLTVPAGTLATVVNGYIGGGNTNIMRVLHTSTIQAADPRPVRIAAVLGENALTGTGSPGVGPAGVDNVDGALIVPPGVWIAFMGHSDGGASPLVTLGMSWLAVPA